MKAEEVVDTALGPARVTAVICDQCSHKQARDSTYAPNTGWLGLEQRNATSPSPSIERFDFCSTECLLRRFVPEIFDEQSTRSREVVERLKTLVRELG